MGLTVLQRMVLITMTLIVVSSLDLISVLAQSLQVFDSNGTKVGSDVIGMEGEMPLIAFSAPDARVFLLSVTTNALQSNLPLAFESPDCSGTPFLTATDSLVAPVSIAPPDNTVYLPVPESLIQSVTVGSLQSSDSTCLPIPSIGAPIVFEVYPAQGIGNLATLLPFIPPFRIQLAPPPALP